MSISRDFDAWMDERGIEAEAEIVLDHECQVFLPVEGVRISLKGKDGETGHSESAGLEEARALISDLLN